MQIRTMDPQDVSAVTLIEEELCECPWTSNIFQECLKYYHCLVLEDHNEVIGYGMLSCVADESHLLNLGIKKTAQRKGNASKLMNDIINIARSKHSTKMYLEVRENNIPAINLYQKFGFSNIGTRKDYYLTKSGKEDALVLALNIK